MLAVNIGMPDSWNVVSQSKSNSWYIGQDSRSRSRHCYEYIKARQRDAYGIPHHPMKLPIFFFVLSTVWGTFARVETGRPEPGTAVVSKAKTDATFDEHWNRCLSWSWSDFNVKTSSYAYPKEAGRNPRSFKVQNNMAQLHTGYTNGTGLAAGEDRASIKGYSH